MSSSSSLDENLKYISVRNQWGCRPLENALVVMEGKVLHVAGCRVCLYDEEEGVSGEKTLLPTFSDVRSILSVSCSEDQNFVAVCVKRACHSNRATVFVYDMAAHRDYPNTEPLILTHDDYTISEADFLFTGAVFSNDSKLLACHSNRIHMGAMIFDWKARKLINLVKLNSLVQCISFNPANSSRICVGGSDGMFQFWHYTTKNSYRAPIKGLSPDVAYTSHVWVGNDCLVAGTSAGSLIMVVGCDVKVAVDAFHVEASVQVAVASLLLRGNTLLACSREGFVSLFHLARSEGRGTADTVTPVYCCLLKDSPVIAGMSWRRRDSASLLVTVASPQAMHVYDLGPHMQHMLLQPEQEVDPELASRQSQAMEEAKTCKYWQDVGLAQCSWPRMPSQSMVMSYHEGAVRTLVTSCRNSLLLSSSLADASVRVWDYNRVDDSERLTLNFAQNRSELPLTIDMHPSGFFAATGSEDYAVEHAVTNNRLESLRKIPVKVAIEKSTGEAVHNTSRVSLVKYSYGGHLLAVVTGKLAQVFLLNQMNYSYEKTGTPERLMVMTDHYAPITDLVFSTDDSKLYTASSDGNVFEWTVSKHTVHRDSDFILKNVSANQVAISPSNAYIMASFRQSTAAKHLTKQPSELSDTHNNRSRKDTEVLDTPKRPRTVTHSHSLGEDNASASSRSFLVVWKDKITSADVDSDKVILEMECPVTAICFGRIDGRDAPEICVLGLANGSVLVSTLPLPQRVFVPAVQRTPTIATLNSFSKEHNQPSHRDLTATNSSKGASKPQVMAHEGGWEASEEEDAFFRMPSIEESHSGSRSRNNSEVYDSTEITRQPSGSLSIPRLKSPTHRRTISRGSSFGMTDDNRHQFCTLDEKLCRVVQLHEGAVTSVCVSSTGLWIFTAGQDGCLFMLNASLRAKEMVEVIESQSNENLIILTDRVKLKDNLSTLEDKDALIEEMEKEKKKQELELNQAKESEKAEITELMTREVGKRDDIIKQNRNDMIQMKAEHLENLSSVHKDYRGQLAELEVMYERKLAHESIYLQNMKQAYDEFVTHARMDLEEASRRAQTRELELRSQNDEVTSLSEKNKKILLQYCEYVGERHREVLSSLTEQHDKEKEEMNLTLKEKQEEIHSAQADFRHERAKVKREMNKLGAQMTAKDMEVLNTAQELERTRDRASRLETALQSAMEELQRKQEALTRLEFKGGEQQQKLSELERVRKALVSQLHALREEMGPKDMQIIRTTDKLHEVDHEYEKSMKAITEKEQRLAQNANTLSLMNKQVRELRLAVTNKEKALKRASQLLDEFRHSLQQARFSSHKTTVLPSSLDPSTTSNTPEGGVVTEEGREEGRGPNEENQSTFPRGTKKTGRLSFGAGGEIVELISSTPAMEMALKRLHDVLNPHADQEDGGEGDEQKVIEEKDRQIAVLRKNVAGLQANIKLNENVSNLKIHNYLTNNENLNRDMNALRKKVGKLSAENHSLKAFIANEERARNARKPAEMRTVDGESANKLLPSFEKKTISPSMPEPEGSLSLPGSAAPKSSGQQRSESRRQRRASEHDKDPAMSPAQLEGPGSSSSLDSSARAEKMIDELFLANSIAIAEESMKTREESTRQREKAPGRVPVVSMGFEEGAKYSTRVKEFGKSRKAKKLSKALHSSTPSLRETSGQKNHLLATQYQTQSSAQLPSLRK